MEDTVTSRGKALGALREIIGNLCGSGSQAGTALTKCSILVGPEPVTLIDLVVTTGNSLL